MKKFLPVFFLVFGAWLTCNSQSFKLADDSRALGNGTEVFQSGPSDTLQLITWLHLTNSTANSLQVMMKKEELSMLPGASSSICWAGYCYGPAMMVSTFPLSILPGETASGCFCHFGPNGCRGLCVIRWTFFKESDPSDSISITVHYSTYPTSTSNKQTPHYILAAAGQVPANNQIAIRYAIPPGTSGRIELRSPSGTPVECSESVSSEGTVFFRISELPSGIFYCTLLVEGNPVVTRKVAVCH